ncbi:DUF4870 domain-containing protein [Actinocorallia populi]|uniref:DUF4870 domain-containing protein n=1 Tax=Actinocorallia populi TaxID=2079200 RepID=UPI000D09272C|nr:DUF4870 domain-containing protein [Actinocorallia populi]
MSDPYGNPYGHQQPYGQQPYGHQPPYGQQQPPFAPPQAFVQTGPPVAPGDERTYAMAAHLGQLILGVFAPLLTYLLYKDRSQYIRWHSAQGINFAITGFVYMMAGLFLSVITFGIGLLLFLPLAALEIIFLILAGVAASRGEWYRYPQWLALPMVS